MTIKTSIHIEQIRRNKLLNPNSFDLDEKEFENAIAIANDLKTVLHDRAGHSIGLACSATLFVYESLIEELVILSSGKTI